MIFQCTPRITKVSQVEKFIKTLEAKVYLKMTVNDRKSYLSDLNKLVDQYNNAYHHSINKKSSNADYSALNEKIETDPKAPKFKVNDRVRITRHKNIFSKGYWSREKFVQEKYSLLILF